VGARTFLRPFLLAGGTIVGLIHYLFLANMSDTL
jgi:hypothetical protein